MADIKLNQLGDTTDFARAYVETESGEQKGISKANLSNNIGVGSLKNNTITSGIGYVYGEKSDGTQGRISIKDISDAVVEDHLSLMATGVVLEQSNPAWSRKGNTGAIDHVIDGQGSWVFDAARKVRAKLSPSDHAYFEDGTEWNGTTGDAFRKFGTLYYLVKTENGVKEVWGSDSVIEGGHVMEENWVGCYKGYVDGNGKLRSIPNVRCMGGKTMSQFWSCAQANSVDYGLMDYNDHRKMMLMHLLHFGNANSETTMGKGLQDAGGSSNDQDGHTYYQPTTGYCHAIGDGTGEATYKTSAHKMNCLFGIEGLAGSQWEFRPNIRFDGATAIVYEGNVVSNTENGRTFQRIESAKGQYITKMALGEYFDMIPIAVGGNPSTFYCDGNWAATGGEMLLVGGHSNLGAICGLSAADSLSGFSSLNAHIGSRLAFKGNASDYKIVSGAAFMS